MRESLLRQRRRRGGAQEQASESDVNPKKMPQLLEVTDAAAFYGNDLLKVGIHNKDIVMKRN